MAKESPTTRSLALLREQGYTVAVVEKWNPHARIRQDLFGFIDILAIKRGETLAVQATASGVSARLKKINDSELLPKVREAGWTIQIWGWTKSAKTGKYVLSYRHLLKEAYQAGFEDGLAFANNDVLTLEIPANSIGQG